MRHSNRNLREDGGPVNVHILSLSLILSVHVNFFFPLNPALLSKFHSLFQREMASGVSKWSDALTVWRIYDPYGTILESDICNEKRSFVITYVPGEGISVGAGMALISY